MAISHVNEKTDLRDLLPEDTLVMDVEDPKMQEFELLRAGSKFLEDNVVGIIGGGTSALSQLLQWMILEKGYNTPNIAFSSTAPALSDKVAYPSFSRTCPSDDHVVDAMLDFFVDQGFEWVASIAQSDFYGLGASEAFSRALEAKNEGEGHFQLKADEHIDTDLSIDMTSAQKENLKDQLKRIRLSRARVIVMFAGPKQAAAVLKTAQELKMTGKGYTWVGSDWVVPSTWTQIQDSMISDEVAEAISGAIGFAPPVNDVDRFQQDLEAFMGANETTLAAMEAACGVDTLISPSILIDHSYTAQAYDAVLSLANAISATKANAVDISSPSGHEQITSSLRSLKVETYGHTIAMNEQGDADPAYYDVRNLQKKEVKLVGSWSSAEGLTLDEDAIIWMGDSSDTPTDRGSLHDELEATYLLGISSLLVIAFLVANYMEIKHVRRFPETGGVVLLGVCVGGVIRLLDNEELIETAIFNEHIFNLILLPIIIFESGYGMPQKGLFFQNMLSILTYAVLGSIFSTIVIGSVLVWMSNNDMLGVKFSFEEVMAYASLVSATDPVSTLSVFGSLGVDPLLNVLVFGESVMNDASAIVLFRTFTGFMTTEITGFGVLLAVGNIIWLFVGSTIIGVIVGMTTSLIAKHAHFHDKYITTTVIFLMSYVAFILSECFHLSGIVASLFCGISMAYFVPKNMSKEDKDFSKSTMRMMARFSETTIFFLVGENVLLEDSLESIPWTLVGVTIVLCLIVRAVMVTLFSAVINCFRGKEKVTKNRQIMMWHAGLRGAIAYALAVSFPSQNRRAVISATMWFILFTIFVLGTSTYDMLTALKIPMGINYEKTVKVHRDHDISVDALYPAWFPGWAIAFSEDKIKPFFTKHAADPQRTRVMTELSKAPSTFDLAAGIPNGDVLAIDREVEVEEGA